MIGGENDRIKTFKLLPFSFKRRDWPVILPLDLENNFSLEADTESDSFATQL